MTEEAKNKERLLWALQERAKELSCLYEIEELLNEPELPLGDLFRGVIRALPPGWQYPEITHARITFDGRASATSGFADYPWRQTADVVVNERIAPYSGRDAQEQRRGVLLVPIRVRQDVIGMVASTSEAGTFRALLKDLDGKTFPHGVSIEPVSDEDKALAQEAANLP